MSARDALVVLTAELPNLGNPFTAGLASGFGCFVGVLVARLRGVPDEQLSSWARDGAFVGFGVGCSCWLVALAIDLL